MADEPVTVLRDPSSVRLARWMRRHRTLAAGTAVFLAVAAVSSSVATWLINGQRAEAVYHQRLAESNLARARQVVDEMYIQVAGQLEDVPRMDDYQRTLLEKARDFYEDEALPQSQDPATREPAAARTQLRLGYIHQKLGRLDAARSSIGRALALYESLSRDDPHARSGRGSAIAEGGPRWDGSRSRPGISGPPPRSSGERSSAGRNWSGAHRPTRGLRLELGIAWRELGRGSPPFPAPRRGRLRLPERRAADRGEAAGDPGEAAYGGALANALDDVAQLYTEENRDPECEALRRRALAFRRAAPLASRPPRPESPGAASPGG